MVTSVNINNFMKYLSDKFAEFGLWFLFLCHATYNFGKHE